MEKLKMGVIGAGYLGTYHIQNYIELEDVDFLGIYDINQSQAQAVAQRFGVKAYPSLKELCDQVSAVSIAVPTVDHADVASRVIERKVHVLVEKPLAASLPEADGLIDLARQHQVMLQVGHIERFNPAVTSLSEMPITPRFIESHRLAPFNLRGTDVAVILDLMIHDIDLALYFVKSPVVSVKAVGVPVISSTEDIANARLQFKNGCIANITASRISLSPMRKMRIFQENTYLSLDLLKNESEIYHLCRPPETAPPGGRVIAELTGSEKSGRIFRKHHIGPASNPLRDELASFVQAILHNTPSPVPGEAGRAALKIALDIANRIKSNAAAG